MWVFIARQLATLLVIALGIYIAFCLALFVFQRDLIYSPQARQNFEGSTILILRTTDGDTIAISKELRGEKALIYFGGNAEDVSQSLPLLSKTFPDCSIFLLNYRGYGGSGGKPSEVAIIADAEKLFDIVYANHKKVLLIGRSLGSGVATHLASTRPVQKLILVTPYDSVQEVAAAQFRYVPVRWLLRDKFESWKYAAQIISPTLLIAAEHDEVITRERTNNLLSHFTNGIADLKIVPGTGHNDIANSPEYVQLLRSAW
jgi:pimeloyl-ACP methyl ester carboxylesterase